MRSLLELLARSFSSWLAADLFRSESRFDLIDEFVPQSFTLLSPEDAEAYSISLFIPSLGSDLRRP